MKWVAYFKVQSGISLEDIKKICLEIISTDKYKMIGSDSFRTYRFEGLSEMNRSQLEGVLIPSGLVSLIPKELKEDETTPDNIQFIPGTRLRQLTCEELSKAKEFILTGKSRSKIKKELSITGKVYDANIGPLKEIWLKEK